MGGLWVPGLLGWKKTLIVEKFPKRVTKNTEIEPRHDIMLIVWNTITRPKMVWFFFLLKFFVKFDLLSIFFLKTLEFWKI